MWNANESKCPTLVDSLPITAVILAGGEGRRMGGMDKGLLPWQGQTLVEHHIERLRPLVRTVMISANRNLDRYAALGCKVVVDEPHLDFQGPLSGIKAALQCCDTDLLLSLPCDCPAYPSGLSQSLIQALGTHQESMAAYAVTANRSHPTFALWRRAALPSLTAFLDEGQRKLTDCMVALKAIAVEFEHESDFTNLNTPNDWALIKASPTGSDQIK